MRMEDGYVVGKNGGGWHLLSLLVWFILFPSLLAANFFFWTRWPETAAVINGCLFGLVFVVGLAGLWWVVRENDRSNDREATSA